MLTASPGASGVDVNYRLYTIAKDLRWPWSLAKLPGGDFLVTEREGRLLRLTRTGEKTVIEGGPPTLFAGQGGYFDVILDLSFTENRRVYLSYAEGVEKANGTAVFRARLEGSRLVEGERLLRVRPDKTTPQHYGGRLLAVEEDQLLVTTGDGFEHREAAQDWASELGKVLRITTDGDAVGVRRSDAGRGDRVWTRGHRNPQGLAMDRQRNRIFLHEHGPRGGDEVNVLRARENYGWPAVTHGVDYSGAYVSPFRQAPGMRNPLWTWTPSIAPSGLAYYDGDRFPAWRDSLFAGALVDRCVRRLQLHEGEVIREERLFTEIGERIRDVRVFDDELYLLTDGEQGSLIQVIPY
jgi:glucose/arabinose dehydrogenase